jgi:UPF0755 protein
MRDRVRALWLGRITLWILIPLVLLAGVLFWAAHDYYGPGPLDQNKVVVIDKGASLEAISTALADAGVIDHPRIFALGATLVGRAAGLKAGEYEFPARISSALAVELLDSGKVVRHKLTIPEGLTSAEVTALLASAPALDGTIDPMPAEGSLLPETYQYLFGERREDLVTRMSRGMAQALDAAWAHRSAGLPLKTPEEALILASIVEKETARPEERARIAGVYIERLKRGMKLQADPTVAYAVTKGGTAPMSHPLDHADLAINSPYNTYLVKGLPPTPIANPGLASIQAAVNPDDRGELYFVADGKGGHTFSKNLAEHNQGVTQLRRHKHKPAVKAVGQTGAKSP